MAVTVGLPSVMEETPCLSNSTFSVDMNVSGVVSKPATVTVVYGGATQTGTVRNDLIHLGLTGAPPTLTSSNEAHYTVTGVCDSSIKEPVVLTVDESSNNGKCFLHQQYIFGQC